MEKTTTGGGGGRTGVGGQYGRARKGTELVKGTRLQRRRANGALWSDVGLCAANWAALTRIQNALSSHHSLSPHSTPRLGLIRRRPPSSLNDIPVPRRLTYGRFKGPPATSRLGFRRGDSTPCRHKMSNVIFPKRFRNTTISIINNIAK